MTALTSAERRALRARAYALHPVVTIGHHGLTAPVLHEIDLALLAQELVKVRILVGDRGERDAIHARICAELDAAPVQHIGKLVIVYRPAPPEVVAAPAQRPAGGKHAGRKPRAVKQPAAPHARRTPREREEPAARPRRRRHS